ncbi:hypothetical protein CASFOL_018433 [Castilleja foliolosa]|uniref:Uncharacterized protein n=1 Tax=Castilleja foliolosa TaxID=1961234 RepID=A0ABD3D6T0_9LAMI
MVENVEDGHTLHMVVRQPVAPSSEVSDHPGDQHYNNGTLKGPGLLYPSLCYQRGGLCE